MYATGVDKTLVETTIENTVDAEKMHLIENNATAILSIDNPTGSYDRKGIIIKRLFDKKLPSYYGKRQLARVRNNAFAIRYIRNPSDNVINTPLEKESKMQEGYPY